MFNVKSKRVARPLEQGDPVRVVAHVGGNLDDGSSFGIHGEEGHVIGSNPTYIKKNTGERMTAIELENGAIVTVPNRALKRG